MASDKFANIATVQVTETAADVITFQELRTQVGIEPDRESAQAMIIDEIDYLLDAATLGALSADGDALSYAVTISNAVPALNDFTDRRILHSGFVQRNDFGVAASGWVFQQPLVYQFFPPLITAERSLFLGVQGSLTGIANILRARIYHRIVRISQAEFLELAEVFRLVG